MSVINKMLRDLDQRQAVQTPLSTVTPSAAQTPLRQGTYSIAKADGANGPLSRRRVWMGFLSVVVAAMVGMLLWTQWGQDGIQNAVVTANQSAPAPSAAASTTVHTNEVVPPVAPNQPAAANTPPSADATANAVPGAMVLRMEDSLSARRALDALLSTPAPAAPAAVSAPAVAPANAAVVERSKARVVAAGPVITAAPTAPVVKAPVANLEADAMPAVQRQQPVGNDALAQAQSLWATGSRDAAMELLQQSIAAAERSGKAANGGSANPAMLPLVREMARMQLAEGRYGAVWEMLTRLESQLGNQPDLWAIRANAAQRLGRHQDSVHAYMVALQSRPDEQRWLLGTAVSLAALGQTSSASEMAEKARTVGPVAKDIVAYLRQSGVNLRD